MNETETPGAGETAAGADASVTGTTVAGTSAVTGNTQVVYILYLLGYLTGLTAIAGLIWAYLNDEQGGHTQFQIRTFWLGLLMLVISVAFNATGIGAIIGVPLLLLWFVWSLVRNISGFRLALDKKGLTDSSSWGFLAR